MKKVLAFDIDQTLNIAKTPITDEIADLLVNCLNHFEICPISGQKFDQFLVQIVNRLKAPTKEQLSHLHLFVAQGTQYYRFNIEKNDWELVYNYPLTDKQVQKISETIERSARELGYWEEDKLQPGDEIIEIAFRKSPFQLSAKKLEQKKNTPGTRIAKNAKKSWQNVKNTPLNLTTKLAALHLLTLSHQV